METTRVALIATMMLTAVLAGCMSDDISDLDARISELDQRYFALQGKTRMITATPARTTSSLLLPWGLSRSVSNPTGPTARRRIPRSPNGKVGFLHCRRSWSCGLFSEDKELFGSMDPVLSVPEGVDYVPCLSICVWWEQCQSVVSDHTVNVARTLMCMGSRK